jgi:hypothetical protein
MNRTATGTNGRRGLSRERNNQMKVVIGAVKRADHDNIWEVEQLRDSLEMHRIWHPFCEFVGKQTLTENVKSGATTLLALLPTESTLQLIYERTKQKHSEMGTMESRSYYYFEKNREPCSYVCQQLNK